MFVKVSGLLPTVKEYESHSTGYILGKITTLYVFCYLMALLFFHFFDIYPHRAILIFFSPIILIGLPYEFYQAYLFKIRKRIEFFQCLTEKADHISENDLSRIRNFVLEKLTKNYSGYDDRSIEISHNDMIFDFALKNSFDTYYRLRCSSLPLYNWAEDFPQSIEGVYIFLKDGRRFNNTEIKEIVEIFSLSNIFDLESNHFSTYEMYKIE